MSPDRPICAAKRRNGEACRKLPMQNGRCHLHGGKTPPRNSSQVERE
ncbi:HGGxSTG domain-containing protein [Sphingobium limneticum]